MFAKPPLEPLAAEHASHLELLAALEGIRVRRQKKVELIEKAARDR